VVGFVVLTAPFVYVLLNAGSLFNLLWVLILTPFYGLIVMTLVYPTVMLLYYVVSFGSLLSVFLLRKKIAKLRNK
jgi:hypothetical protein